MKKLWLYRRLLNWQDIFEWAQTNGVKKLLPPEELHLTLATCRQPVDWNRITLMENDIFVPAGHKVVQIFGYVAKAIAFGHPEIAARHAQLVAIYPTMDHSDILRPHLTIMRGGKMPKVPFLGSLHFGPERMEEFDERKIRSIKHVIVRDIVGEPL